MTVNVDLSKPADNQVQFLVDRAQAIEAYARVEQSLNTLFSMLIGAAPDVGAIVFFRITNAKSRNVIIAELLTKKFGATYEAYWHGIPNTPNKRGLMTLINQLDGRRNEIVHWHTAVHIDVQGDRATSLLKLGRPNFWAGMSSDQFLTETDLRDFCLKADFVWRSLNMFTMIASDKYPDIPERQAWLEIYQQPCIYPPPDSHLLARKPVAP